VTERRIAVVGAGLGGLSVAARLASDGHQVDVFDSQDFPGGKAGTQQLGDYRFDTGPSLVTMPEVFDELFAACGETREEFVRFTRLDEICRYLYADGTRLSSFADPARFAAEIDSKTADSSASILRFLEYAARIYRVSADLFLRKSLHEFRTYASWRGLASILSLGRIDPLRTMDRAVRSFFTDPRTVQFFNRYATYNGSNPYRTPATLNIIPHVEYGIGAAAADDGVFAIPSGLARLAEKKGARLHLGIRVDRIVYEEDTRRIRGIVADGEQMEYDAVVSNSDVVRTYRTLLEDEDAPLLKRYLKLEPSSSGLVFLLGVKNKFPDLGLHNIFFSGDYHAEFADIFDRHRCPTDPTVYVNITSRVTPADAPARGENWFVLVNAPYDSGQNWPDEVTRTRAAVLDRLSRALSQDIESEIEVESVMTPADIEERTGSRFGSLYGISSNSRMAAFLRHPNRSRRYPGLFFCGGGVHPGGGMPLVVLSGKITADLIRREIRRGRL
jgi:diapolycopene oxygenase